MKKFIGKNFGKKNLRWIKFKKIRTKFWEKWEDIFGKYFGKKFLGRINSKFFFFQKFFWRISSKILPIKFLPNFYLPIFLSIIIDRKWDFYLTQNRFINLITQKQIIKYCSAQKNFHRRKPNSFWRNFFHTDIW